MALHLGRGSHCCLPFCVYRLFPRIRQPKLTPWSRVLLGKPPVAQLLKNFAKFYGNWKFITVFTTALHPSLTWAITCGIILSIQNTSDTKAGLENREYGRRDPSRWPCGTLYPQNLALNSPTSGCRSVGIVRSRIQATEFFSHQYPLCILLSRTYCMPFPSHCTWFPLKNQFNSSCQCDNRARPA
jgi:hypothetical protein